MSVNLDSRVVSPGNDDFVEDAWTLKERIHREEGVLKQRRPFFTDAYRRSTVHCYLHNRQGTHQHNGQDGDEDHELVGFAAVRRDGYILFLAVAPECRGRGIGKRLVARVVDDHKSVTCHARTTNENALQFYENLGFEIKRRIDNYYEDGGDAYYLTLGSGTGLTDRISDFVRR